MATQVEGVYVITGAGLWPGRGHADLARAAVEAEASLLQLRQKEGSTAELLRIAEELRQITLGTPTRFIVNDRVDIALAVGADGVHLGDEDLPVHHARRLMGPSAIIGASVATEQEVREAETDGASYLGVGPIYATGTKSDAGDEVGLEQIRRFRAITRLPIVAIGGITASRAAEVGAAGANGIAVISAVAAAESPLRAILELLAAFRYGRSLARGPGVGEPTG
ncbi:MAG TPA: thiamine phosphate synthase [Armatimonadota bacterium]